MKRKITILLLCVFAISYTQAQKLLTPSFTFSHNKTAYLTLQDGKEIQGTIKDIDRKKGLIKAIKIKDESGKKHEYKPEDVKFMYLPPSGLDKISKVYEETFDVQKWGDDKLNQDYIKKGYIYFEIAEVKVKKKTLKLMMQLLNPGFSKRVKVYHDPYAKETMSVGVGGFDVVGGNAKSYYISKDNEIAFRLFKKNYKKDFKSLWGSCDKVTSEYKDKKWSELTEHILKFTECK